MAVLFYVFLVTLLDLTSFSNAYSCPLRDEAFELVTGYVFTSPDTILDTRPGVLKLEKCIQACQSNSTCLSVNYETGLCILFSTSAEETPGKPVFFVTQSKINY